MSSVYPRQVALSSADMICRRGVFGASGLQNGISERRKKPVISRITGFFPYSEISCRASDAPKRPYSSFSQKSAKAAGETSRGRKTANSRSSANCRGCFFLILLLILLSDKMGSNGPANPSFTVSMLFRFLLYPVRSAGAYCLYTLTDQRCEDNPLFSGYTAALPFPPAPKP